MNRAQLQHLTHERILDAQALLDGGRWSFAYYNVGYAVECALKACFLARMPISGWVFRDKVKIDECRTHNFGRLIELAELTSELQAKLQASSSGNPSFARNWTTASAWSVDSRYALMTSEREARDLFAAINDRPDGVLAWIQNYW